jgi:hypothetical protein
LSTYLAAATARDFITLAMKEAGVLGVGQTLLAEDINDGFTYLQRMMTQWQNRRWVVPSLQDIHAVGNDAISNTVGPGGYFNIDPKPSRINAGYFFQLNTGQTPISLPLVPIFSYEDYARITVKQLNTQPEYFFYDNQQNAGLANVFIWPIPSAFYEIHLVFQSALAWPITVDSVYTLPEEYAEAIHFNLALRFCSAYGLDPKRSTIALGKAALSTVRNANTQIPTLSMPSGLKSGKAFSLWNPDGFAFLFVAWEAIKYLFLSGGSI